MNAFCTLAVVCSLGFAAFANTPSTPSQDDSMELGSFSVSLAVKDIKVSKAFYEKLDFKEVGGNLEHNWLILRSGKTTIGLFQGMFEDNIMTFNPGWGPENEKLEDFDDIRTIQSTLKERGIELITEADESSTGTASVVLADPDGNQILLDQHVPAPGH